MTKLKSVVLFLEQFYLPLPKEFSIDLDLLIPVYVADLFGDGKQTAGYSWHVDDKMDFDDILLILEEAYKIHGGDDLTDLDWFQKN